MAGKYAQPSFKRKTLDSAAGDRLHSLPSFFPGAQESHQILRALLAEPVADLAEITQAIGSDPGLRAQLLLLVARNSDSVPADASTISDIVVHLGLKKLRAICSGRIG